MMWEWAVKGGWTMVPLLGLSIISVAVVLERLITLRPSRVLSKPIVSALEEGRTIGEIRLMLEENTSVLGRFLSKIDSKKSETRETLNDLSHAYFKGVWNELEKNLEFLNIVATTSPLLGLLGTVLGMVRIFRSISQAGGNNAALSGGIAEALITTITGLAIAVPALVFYTYFSKQVERYLLNLEECGKLYLGLLKRAAHVEELIRRK